LAVADDRELARRGLDFEARAKDYPLTQLPGYMAWSERKLAEGESAALIAHLDAMSMCLLPEQVDQMAESDYEELLDELRSDLGR
jgi:hypothetical protein